MDNSNDYPCPCHESLVPLVQSGRMSAERAMHLTTCLAATKTASRLDALEKKMAESSQSQSRHGESIVLVPQSVTF